MTINNGTIAELEYQRGLAQMRCLELAGKYQDAIERAVKAEARVKELEAVDTPKGGIVSAIEAAGCLPPSAPMEGKNPL